MIIDRGIVLDVKHTRMINTGGKLDENGQATYEQLIDGLIVLGWAESKALTFLTPKELLNDETMKELRNEWGKIIWHMTRKRGEDPAIINLQESLEQFSEAEEYKDKAYTDPMGVHNALMYFMKLNDKFYKRGPHLHSQSSGQLGIAQYNHNSWHKCTTRSV